MSFFKKIILIGLTFFIFLILFFVTFFPSSDMLGENRNFPQAELGVFSFSGKKDLLGKKLDKTASGWVLMERINPLTTLFFTALSQYEVKKDATNTTHIELQGGDFFFDTSDINREFIFNLDGFSFILIGGGRFFLSIDTNTSRISILSMDAILHAQLKIPATQELQTNVTLFPHMMFILDSKRSALLKDADSIRVASVHNLSYIASPLSLATLADTSTKLKNSGFPLDFIEFILSYRKSNLETLSRSLSQLIGLQFNFRIPGAQYIEKYQSLFLNKTKKVAFIKAKIVNDIISIFGSKTYNAALTQEIQTLLKDFQSLDIGEYTAFISDINPYLNAFYVIPNTSQIESKRQLFSLFGGAPTYPKDATFIEAGFFLSEIYSFYDYSKDNDVFLKNLSQFCKKYRFQIQGFSPYNRSDTLTNKNTSLEYFSLFLEKMLTLSSHVSSADFISLLDIFSLYTDISHDFYADGNEVHARSGIYTYGEVMKHLLSTMDSIYFQAKRSKNNLLVRQSKYKLNTQYIVSFSENIDILYQFYNQNSKFLSSSDESKDILVRSDFTHIKTLYNEYLMALRDYESYSIQYDGAKKRLIDLESISEFQTRELSLAALQGYLSKFVGIDLQSARITIEKDFYDVQDARIDGNKISFHLYPMNSNELTKIIINSKSLNSSYKLDLIEAQWGELDSDTDEKNPQSETSSKYDFSRFFSLTFFGKDIVKTDTPFVDTTKPSIYESTFVRALKQKILSQPNNIFKNVSSLKISYNTVQVSSEDQDYLMKIVEAPLHGTVQNADTTLILEGFFSSEFIYSSNESIFKSMKIRLSPDQGDGGVKKPFTGIDLVLIGSLPLKDFESRFQKPLLGMARIKTIFSNLKGETPSIFYFVSSDKTSIKFFSEGQQINIQMTGDMVDSLTLAGKNKIKSKIKFTEINQYIR